MKPKSEQGRSKLQDGAAHPSRRAWPLDVMVSAAAMVVDEKLPVARVSEKLKVPYLARGRARSIARPGVLQLTSACIPEACHFLCAQ